MLRMEHVMEIQILHKQGLSIRKIAKQLGVSRNTVRKHLKTATNQPICYKKRPQKPRLLDPYEDFIQQRLKEAAPHWIPAPALLREIQAKGYQGGISTLRQYMAKLKPTVKQAPIQRFETAAGEQMQVDWACIQRGKQRILAFVAMLGFSRYAYVEFTQRDDFEALKTCHENAFTYFGGVPRNVLYDNMKTVVIQRNAFGDNQHRFHQGLWQLAKQYGFKPRLCRPYRPQTKGKVERFIRYVRENFYQPLRSRLLANELRPDVDTLNYEVLRWLREVANVRIHETTGAMPKIRLIEEQQALQPLPQRDASQPSSICTHLDKYTAEPLHHSLSIYDEFCSEVVR